MATKKIGKLTYKLTSDGLLFRWGDEGEVKRIGLGPLGKLIDRNGANGDYDDQDGYDDRGYDDGYGDDRYDDDGYDSRGGRYDDDRYDDVYDSDSRSGGRYNDRYDSRYDDGYDNGYDDDRYNQPDDDEPYYEPDYEDDQTPSRLDKLWELVDRFPWIVYVLLVLVPPLGIYLLWRQGMFDFTIRTAISVVSGIWFLVLVIWVISGLTGGSSGDPTTAATPGINLASPTATVEPAETADALDLTSPTDEPDTAADPAASALPDASVEPTATALVSADAQTNTGDTAAEDASSTYVYSPTTGAYYHKTSTCSSIGTTAVTQVTLDIAQNRGQTQCPTCYGSTTYYMTSGGKYYHSNATCTDMQNAEAVTKEVATKAGKTACPECVREFYISSSNSYYHSKSNCSSMTNASQTTINAAKAAGKTACPTCVGTSTTTKSTAAPTSGTDYSKATNKYDAGVIVYAKKGGSYYHAKSSCSATGMSGGQKITLYNAIELGFSACKSCLPDGNDTVYCTNSGASYHSYSTCSGITNAIKTSRAKAIAVGKSKCPYCWSGSSDSSSSSNSSNSSSSGSTVTASGPSVYITSENNYYHTRKACNGMEDPTKISLREAMSMGKKACPDCAGQADKTVYATSGVAVYHYSSSCSKLSGKKVSKATLAQALADELSACSVCVNNNSSESTENAEAEEDVENDIVDKSGISVYITKSGGSYHSSTSCSELGAEEYYKVSLGVADAYGKDPCSKCCATASHKVYSSSTDTRYHFDKNCSLLPGTPKAGTLAKALMYGLKACPACTSDDDDEKVSISATPAPEIVSISASVSGKKVYATKTGSKYHISSSCSKLKGYEVKGISLETAKNYGLSACSTCSSVAKKTVYGNSESKYYHKSSTCNGVKYTTSGTLEKALLAGLKACPICVSGSSSGSSSSSNSSGSSSGSSSSSNNSSSSSGSSSSNDSSSSSAEDTGSSTGGSASGTTKVYIDLSDNSEVYHKSSKCSKIDDGVGVTLNYVLDMGFKACSKCNPPTSASD